MSQLQSRIGEVTERIVKRSRDTRERYLDQVRTYGQRRPRREHLSCGNLAHGFAACDGDDKDALSGAAKSNIAIVSAYNDMLSAHQPLERFPALIKQAVRDAGGVAQFAGGVPAMCDGVTQGQAGMELSLFSRDVIAMATAVALEPRHVRRRALSGRLRQDRAGPGDGGLELRPPARDLRARRADDHGHAQQREVAHPPALCRGQGRPQGAARGRERLLSRPRHLHLLRHRQHQPDAHGDHGAASARRELRQPEHALARRADDQCRQADHRDHRTRQRVHADRRDGGRARGGQRRGRPARYRRLDQPHAASRGHGARRRHPAQLGRFRRRCRRSCRCCAGSTRTGSPT